MKTAVVILNWNTKGYLEKFVPGILHSLEGTDAELVVADSASTDGSMQMMAEKFPEVRRITLDKNYGFTGGYNRALSMIETEYYVLINSDIEVQDGWIQPLTETLDRDPEVGACAPKLHSWYERDMFEYAGAAGGYLDSFGFPLCRGRIMNMVEKDEGQYDSPADVFWATGACLMIRSSLFRELGGLDDRFFAHMEEIDLCWRLQLNGYRIRIVPQSTVYHLGGGTLPQTSPWKLKLNYRNNLLMLENNLARTIALYGQFLQGQCRCPRFEETGRKGLPQSKMPDFHENGDRRSGCCGLSAYTEAVIFQGRGECSRGVQENGCQNGAGRH